MAPGRAPARTSDRRDARHVGLRALFRKPSGGGAPRLVVGRRSPSRVSATCTRARARSRSRRRPGEPREQKEAVRATQPARRARARGVAPSPPGVPRGGHGGGLRARRRPRLPVRRRARARRPRSPAHGPPATPRRATATPAPPARPGPAGARHRRPRGPPRGGAPRRSAAAPVAGELGSWTLGRRRAPTRRGSSRRRTAAPGTRQVRPWSIAPARPRPSAGRARWAPVDGRTAGRRRRGEPRAPAAGRCSRARTAPGRGASRSTSRFADGDEAPPGTGGWRSCREPRNRRRRRWTGGVVGDRVGGPPGPAAQARAPAAGALKIETCASSGSITPKIFCSVRRWTQEPQLSK